MKEGRNQQEIKASGDTLDIKSEAKRPGDRKIKSSREERNGKRLKSKDKNRERCSPTTIWSFRDQRETVALV